MPGGKYCDSSAMRARIASAVASALAPVASWKPMAAAGWPLYLLSMLKFSAPSPMRATSRRRTCEPSGLTFSRMRPNSSGVRSSVDSVIAAVSRCVAGAGVPPSWPPEICTFWLCRAFVTSTGVSEKLLSLFGSSQIRMAYCVPNTLMLPTPSSRLTGSCTCETT